MVVEELRNDSWKEKLLGEEDEIATLKNIFERNICKKVLVKHYHS